MTSKKSSPKFSGKTRAEWLEIIRADLKDKDIETLKADWLTDLSLSPFQHPENVSQKNPPLHRAFDEPKLVQAFPTTENLGSELLEALQEGVSAPFFPDPLPWSSLWSSLNEVHWDMLFPIWTAPVPENPEAPHHPEQYSSRFYLNGPHQDSLDYRRSSGRLCFSVPSAPAKDLPDRLADWLVDIVQQLDDLESPQVGLLFKNALHKKNMGRNFYLELAAIRAMRRLSNQLQQDYKVPDPTPIKIYAHVGPELALNNLQESMIAYTTAAWAAVTGGADFIHIEPQAAASDPLSQQLARNVFHLFDMESHLLHVIDPAAGSYAIESLTTRLAERAWEQFKTSIDDD